MMHQLLRAGVGGLVCAGGPSGRRTIDSATQAHRSGTHVIGLVVLQVALVGVVQRAREGGGAHLSW